MSDGTKARDAYASKKDFEKSSIQHSFSPSPSELGTAQSQLVSIIFFLEEGNFSFHYSGLKYITKTPHSWQK